MFVAVTVFPVSTFASAKVFGPAAEQVTFAVSPTSTPVKVQPVMKAVVLPSYVLFDAVTFAVTDFGLTVSVAAVVVAVCVPPQSLVKTARYLFPLSETVGLVIVSVPVVTPL